MNKKQKNRKLVTQNTRNRIINRRYSSTIKSLSKLFTSKIKTIKTKVEGEVLATVKTDIVSIVRNLYSIIDKAVKKGVIHKNTAARKKSKIGLISKQIQH
jgi:small subunit ribosomal protein S20